MTGNLCTLEAVPLEGQAPYLPKPPPSARKGVLPPAILEYGRTHILHRWLE